MTSPDARPDARSDFGPSSASALPHRWLVDHVDGLLSPDRARRLRERLAAGDPKAEAALARIRELLTTLRAGPLDAPPTAQNRRAVGLLRSTGLLALPPVHGGLEGTLVLDRRPELAGSLRSARGARRRLLWTVGEHEIDAELTARRRGTDLLGQVLPPDAAPDPVVEGHVEAVTRRSRVRADLAADGRFTFRALPSGACRLNGSLDGARFHLPPVLID